jgi:predicted permease
LSETALKLLTPSTYRNDQVGDLREAYHARQARTGRREARRWYRLQVLKSILPNLRLHAGHLRTPPGRASEPWFSGGTAPLQDVRQLVRSIKRKPLFYSVIVLTYSLGIGAAAVVFSVVDGVLLRPLPFPDSERLVRVYQTNPGLLASNNPSRQEQWNRILLSFPEFNDWLDAGTPFEAVGIYTGADYIVTGGDRPERVSGIRATEGVFSALGVPAMLGRVFIPSDDEMGARGAVVLGHGLWERRYGADSTVVGGTLVLDGLPYRIVGVMPPGFSFPDDSELWTTFTDSYRNRPRFAQFANAVAKLPPGISLGQAQQAMDLLVRQVNEANSSPSAPQQAYGVRLLSLKADVVGNVRPAILLILAAVALVLLVACANNVTLLLLRNLERGRELAVRAALGAGRWRLLRTMMAESVALSVLGGLLGWLLAWLSLEPFLALLPADTPRLSEVGLDARIIGFGVTLSVLAGLSVGSLPAFASARTAPGEALGASSPRTVGASKRARTQRVLVVAEVALSFVLLVGAGVLTRSFLRLTSVDLGFRAEDLVTLRLDLRGPRYPNREEVNTTYRILEEELASLPGVTAVAGTGTGPFFGQWKTQALGESGAGGIRALVGINEVTPTYHNVMEIPLVAGRYFSTDDQSREPPVAIVSDKMAEALWPNEPAIGRRVKLDGVGEEAPWYTVVGVVRDVRRRMEADPFPTAYRIVDYEERLLWIRTAITPASVMASIRESIHNIDPNLPVLELNTLEQRINSSVALPRVRLVLLCSLAGLAAALALIGIFSVLASAVAQRTNELGVRRALGAERGDVVFDVLQQGAFLSVLGLAIGLAVFLVASRALGGILFHVQPLDPGTLILVTGLLMTATLGASYLPARRAAVVDPVEALRRE